MFANEATIAELENVDVLASFPGFKSKTSDSPRQNNFPHLSASAKSLREAPNMKRLNSATPQVSDDKKMSILTAD